jgi:probable rRNA maturation factor
LAEVTFLLAHGLLHLLGYDHATAAQERRMTGHTLRLVAATTGRGHAAVDSLGAIVPRSLRG